MDSSYKNAIILMIFLSIILIWSGISNIQLINTHNVALKTWQQDSIRTQEELYNQNNLLSRVNPDDDWIRPRLSQFAEPLIDAAQGVEVHLEGIRWMGKWFTKNKTHGIEDIGGRAEVEPNLIIFDPDFEKAGMPDLSVEVTVPRFFLMSNFLEEWFGGIKLKGLLGDINKKQSPVNTYDLETSPGKRRKMSLWLMEYDAILRIAPSPSHDNSNFGGLAKHPVSGISTNKIRRDREAKNQRYGNVSIMMKFKPKQDTWYVADYNNNGILVPNGEPKIGIAAVECIGIKQLSENNTTKSISVFLNRGSSLALYNAPEEIDSKFHDRGIEYNDVLKPSETIKNLHNSFIGNPDLFGKDKYSILHISNLGSWKEGSVLTGSKLKADLYHAKFVIHVYVLGEWNVKPTKVASLEPRPPFEQKKAGLMDFLLPDFNIPFFGKFLSLGGWLIVVFILLSIFSPPLAALFNKILMWIVALIPSPKKKV